MCANITRADGNLEGSYAKFANLLSEGCAYLAALTHRFDVGGTVVRPQPRADQEHILYGYQSMPAYVHVLLFSRPSRLLRKGRIFNKLRCSETRTTMSLGTQGRSRRFPVSCSLRRLCSAKCVENTLSTSHLVHQDESLNCERGSSKRAVDA